MRIAYIATTVHLSSSQSEALGSTTHTLAVARELKKMGHELFLFSERFDMEPTQEDLEGLRIIRLLRAGVTSSVKIKKSKWRRILKIGRIVPNFWLAWQIRRIIKKENIDIIFERAHSRGVGGLASLLTGKPLILEVIDNIFSKISIWRARKIIAYTKEFFSNRIKKKVVLVRAGFEKKFFYPIRSQKKYDFGYAGGFKEWDGLEDLVMAAKVLVSHQKSTNFLLIGDGERFEKVKNMIKEFGLENNFKLIGRVPIAEVSSWLAQVKVGVAPYNVKNSKKGGFEKFGFYFSPLKIFEYMGCGLPVLASNYQMIRKILPQGAGYLFEPGDTHDLAAKMLKLIQNDTARRSMKKNSIDQADQFTWRMVATSIETAMLIR